MASTGGKKFRNDIEGLRGFAIALVVIFHVFVGKVSSGVDVFLLLGGVFFFGSQLANARNPKGLTFVQSLVRIIRRLFPLLAVVVGATLAAGLLLMPRIQHLPLAKDAVGALAYITNWQLAFSGRDYNTASSTVSPFQHLWSMSAQLQIYVASLIAVTLIALIFRRFSRKALAVILTAVTVLSFAFATYQHGQDQAVNYYHSFSRFWEIGLGGLLGMLIMPRSDHGEKPPAPIVPPLNTWVRQIFGWLGLIMIASTGLIMDGAQTFPGPGTLFPLVGAVMVILAGQNGKPVGITRFLESRFMQFLGRISYALYLWHWPLLIILVSYTGYDAQAQPLFGVAIIAASVVMAWLSNRFIERPLRQTGRPRRAHVLWTPSYWWESIRVWPKTAYALVIILIAGGVVAAAPVVAKNQVEEGEELWRLASNVENYPGPLAFSNDAFVPPRQPLAPPFEEMGPLLPPTQPDGCQIGFEGDHLILTRNFNRSEEECAYGDLNSERTVYVIGGSHSEQFIPALDEVGRRQGVKFMPILKMGCAVNANIPKFDGTDYPSCRSWSKKVVDHILAHPPTEGVWMTGTRPSDIAGNGPEQVPPEYVDLVKLFTDNGIHSYLMRDNAWHIQRPEMGDPVPFNLRECVGEMVDGTRTATERGRNFPGVRDRWRPTPEEIEEINAECGTAQDASLLPEDPQYQAYAGLDVTLLDVTDGFCKDGWCPAIIGNLVAYRDQHHFTNIFASRFADAIEHQMYKEPRGAEGSEDKARKAPDARAEESGEVAPGAPGAEQPGAPGAGQPDAGQPGAGLDAPSPDEIGQHPPVEAPAVPQPAAPAGDFY